MPANFKTEYNKKKEYFKLIKKYNSESNKLEERLPQKNNKESSATKIRLWKWPIFPCSWNNVVLIRLAGSLWQ